MGRENKPEWIIVHHTGGTDINPLADTSNHTFDIVNEWHKKLWNFKSKFGYYIGYHYFIDKRGVVYHGRDDLEEGAHCRGMNTRSIGIAMAGNFDRPPYMSNSYPSKEQIEALKLLLIKLSDKYKIPFRRIVPHRFFAVKTCYGKNLSDWWASNLVVKEVSRRKISILQKMVVIYTKILAILRKIKDKREA